MKNSLHAQRKNEHVFIAEKFFQPIANNQLAEIQLLGDNLPDLALTDIDLTADFLGQKISAPFFINAMTGGSKQTTKWNRQLAKVAYDNQIPFATGSVSIAIKEQATLGFDQIREVNPTGLVLANLGAGHPLQNAQQALTLFNANALEIHLNASQELVMPEGDREFYWSKNIKEIVENLPCPVLVKEVGFGMTPSTLAKLKKLGVQYVDLSGFGGTSFVTIENERRKTKELAYFNELGLSTAKTLIASQAFKNDFSFTASGGIRNALDIVKCLVLGADNVGISGLFLHVLIKEGQTALDEFIKQLKQEIKMLMLLLGCQTVAQLQAVPYVLSPELLAFKEQVASKKRA